MALSLQGAGSTGCCNLPVAGNEAAPEPTQSFEKDLQALDGLLNQLVQKLQQEKTASPEMATMGNADPAAGSAAPAPAAHQAYENAANLASTAQAGEQAAAPVAQQTSATAAMDATQAAAAAQQSAAAAGMAASAAAASANTPETSTSAMQAMKAAAAAQESAVASGAAAAALTKAAAAEAPATGTQAPAATTVMPQKTAAEMAAKPTSGNAPENMLSQIAEMLQKLLSSLEKGEAGEGTGGEVAGKQYNNAGQGAAQAGNPLGSTPGNSGAPLAGAPIVEPGATNAAASNVAGPIGTAGAAENTASGSIESILQQVINTFQQLLAKMQNQEEGGAGQGTGQGVGQGTGQGTGQGVGQGTGQGVGQGTGQGTGSIGSGTAGGVDGKGEGKVPGKSDPDVTNNMGPIVSYKTSSYAGLAENKQKIVESLDAAGATPKEKAFILSAAMVETNSMHVKEGDRLKDSSLGAKNLSALNMNVDMLSGNLASPLNDMGKKTEYPGGPMVKTPVPTYDSGVNLNDQANIGKAAVAFLEGMRMYGADTWLAGQRGGTTAAEMHMEGDMNGRFAGDEDIMKNFYSAVNTGTDAILNDPTLFTDDRRVEPNTYAGYI